jgi:hypothetical protein
LEAHVNTDPILDELHRQRDEFLQECGNDPEIMFRKLKELEGGLPQPVRPAPAAPNPDSPKPRQARG